MYWMPKLMLNYFQSIRFYGKKLKLRGSLFIYVYLCPVVLFLVEFHPKFIQSFPFKLRLIKYLCVIKYVCYPPIDTCVVIQSPIPYSVVNHIIQFDENSTGNRTTGRNSTVQYCITIIQDKSVIKPIENCIFTHPNCIGQTVYYSFKLDAQN